MKISNGLWLLITFSVLSTSAVASEYREHQVLSRDQGSPSPYISLGCVGGKLRISVQWNTQVGTAGKHRRHLVLPGDLGDTHILLKVLPDQTSTGIIDNDQQAKSLIKLILQNIKTDYMVIEVFPEGRDPVTGQWESGSYDYKMFLNAVNGVTKECNWDMTKPIRENARTVNPGAPYDDE